MEFNIPEGITFQKELVVSEKDTAARYGSGLVEVFATPAMVAMMENTCLASVRDLLPDGYSTVGTAIDIKHFKATPVGKTVTCISNLIHSIGRKLVFEVTVSDDQGAVGSGTHTRYVVNLKEFVKQIS